MEIKLSEYHSQIRTILNNAAKRLVALHKLHRSAEYVARRLKIQARRAEWDAMVLRYCEEKLNTRAAQLREWAVTEEKLHKNQQFLRVIGFIQRRGTVLASNPACYRIIYETKDGGVTVCRVCMTDIFIWEEDDVGENRYFETFEEWKDAW